MTFLSPKIKHLLVLIAKIVIVVGAFYFIYNQLMYNEQIDWNEFKKIVVAKQSFGVIALLLVLTFLNRFLEILKWQNLIQLVKKITVWQATQQVLSAITVAIFTPNGIGEYAGKALYYDKKDSGRVIFLNLICNGIQMVLSITIGFAGLLYLNAHYKIIGWDKIFIGFCMLSLLIGIILFTKQITVRGYSLQMLFQKINEIPKRIHRKNIFLALCRYACFSHQYFILYRVFDVEVPYLLLMSAITSVYLLSSSLPTFQIFDFAVKGSVAVFMLGIIGVNDWIVIFITTIIWFLNIVLPVSIGSIFVFKYKPQWK
ncbi:hypothetical protein K5I29_12830 [Flavobacterium agricola]|uniref:Lysylphosphatidylglycerol synthase-like protein n=1 Tax=Flavobacterium agricola TaxID=2870839 RepID=A0ABY6M2F5_9FLAO|nr:hypothetical protein [Flavobacterium agricola]UYW01311.1 hypothetical protein K5I29_12830 [Flavobacterium agricola]